MLQQLEFNKQPETIHIHVTPKTITTKKIQPESKTTKHIKTKYITPGTITPKEIAPEIMARKTIT